MSGLSRTVHFKASLAGHFYWPVSCGETDVVCVCVTLYD